MAAKNTATGTHMIYRITRCYLPPGRDDIAAFTPAKLVLNLATQEGCKAVQTKVAGYMPIWYTHPKTVTVLTGPDVG